MTDYIERSDAEIVAAVRAWVETLSQEEKEKIVVHVGHRGLTPQDILRILESRNPDDLFQLFTKSIRRLDQLFEEE